MLIAQRRLKIGDEFREPGQPVPEAAAWPNLKVLISGGFIVDQPDFSGERGVKKLRFSMVEPVKDRAVIARAISPAKQKLEGLEPRKLGAKAAKTR